MDLWPQRINDPDDPLFMKVEAYRTVHPKLGEKLSLSCANVIQIAYTELQNSFPKRADGRDLGGVIDEVIES